MNIQQIRLATAAVSVRLRLAARTRHILICLVLRGFVSHERKRPRYAIIFETGSAHCILFGMISRYEHQGVLWVDVESPTEDEVLALEQEFKLGPLLTQELLGPTLKPHVDLYPEFAYAVFNFPSVRYTHGGSATQEVDIIIGKKFLITVHYDTIPAIYDFARSFEAATLLKRTNDKFHSGHVLFELTQRLYQGVENELEAIEDTVENIERAIFSDKEREMVTAISNVNRELLIHKRTLGTHQEALDSLEHAGVTLFGEGFRNYLRGISAFHFRVYSRALGYIDTVAELRKTNDSLLSTRQNEVMKNLTVMAFITFPLSLLAAIFGMNTTDNPIIGIPGDFWFIVGGMLIVAAVFFAYFKMQKWF